MSMHRILPLLLTTVALLTAAPPRKSARKSAAPVQAPAAYRVTLDTSKGPVVIDVTRDWSPLGADRFYALVKSGYFDGARFFRIVPGFVVQIGLAGDPALTKKWSTRPIVDEPVKQSNTRGYVTFAMSGKDSRTAQIFINLGDNARLDPMGFTPFGLVSSGMENVDLLNSEYGESPEQPKIEEEGNLYLQKEFPNLDFIRHATVETIDSAKTTPEPK
jgi:peptidyl-prolyl cis-trans isomerase A (cyclophilin A)